MAFRIPPTEELTKVALICVGAGAKGAIAGLVKKVAPDMAVDTAGAIGGALMYLFGDRIHPYVKVAGIGVLAGSVSPMIEKAISGVVPTGGGGGSPSPEALAGEDTLKALAQAQANRQAVYS